MNTRCTSRSPRASPSSIISLAVAVMAWLSLLSSSLSAAPVQIAQETFDGTGIGFTTSVAQFNELATSPLTDYFSIIPNNGTKISGNRVLPGADGANIFAAEDCDTPRTSPAVQGPQEVTLTTNSVSIVGKINTQVRLLMAAPGRDISGSVTLNEYENFANSPLFTNKLKVEASIDGGNYQRIVQFSPSVAEVSTQLSFDSDGNDIGGDANPIPTNPTTLDATLREGIYAIPTGNTVQIRITLESDATGELIVFDNIRIFGEVPASSPPVLAGVPAGNFVFTEGSSATAIAPAITIADSDSANLTAASVQINQANVSTEDVLAATPSGTILAGDIVYTASTGTLTITRSASVANYQAVLRSVTYRDTNITAPSTLVRRVMFAVTDGSNPSNNPIRDINVIDNIVTQLLPFVESFETDGRGTRYSVDGGFSLPPSMFARVAPGAVTGLDGSTTFGVENVDDNADFTELVTFNINTANYTGLTGELRVAAGGGPVYDNNAVAPDFLQVEVSADGGAFQNVLAFYPDATASGNMRQDTTPANGVNLGDGTLLNSTLQTFAFSLPTATTLTVRIRAFTNIVGENILFDRLAIAGTPTPTLAAGDIVVTGMNIVTDTITFMPLVDLPANTRVVFTDIGWLSTNAFHTTLTGDSSVTWTTTATVPKGSLIQLALGGSDNSPPNALTNLTTSTDYTSEAVFGTYTVTDAMAISGDQILIYQGLASNPFFIFGLNNSATAGDATNWNNTDTPTLAISRLPTGTGSQNALTNGVNALGLPSGTSQFDNQQYTGPTTAANRATWLARVTTLANWTGDNAGTTASTISSTGVNVALAPTVTTTAVGTVTVTSAVLGGNVTSDGGATVTDLGIVWGTVTGPTTANNKVANGTGTGSFSATVGSLPAATTIFVRAYATNTVNTSYGGEISFTTLSNNADLSALTTTAGSISPPFGAATTTYTASVSNATTSTTVTATRAQANATLQIQINGGGFSALTSGSASSALTLNVGANPIDVKVTAQDGSTTKTYTITVTRAAPPTQFDLIGTAGSGLLFGNEPAVASGGSGGEIGAGISLDNGTNVLTLNVGWGSSQGFTDLSSLSNNSHIHGPTASINGSGFTQTAGVLFNLSRSSNAVTGGTFTTTTVTLTAGQVTDLLNGKYYINIHTANNGGGELRGFLVVPASTTSTITGISPTTGTTAGGTAVTITGTNLTGATNVIIGGVNATNVTVVNATTITATTGARAAGLVNVVAITSGGAVTGTGLYTYGTTNTAPSIAGAVSGQAVNDNATVSLFSGVTFADADTPAQTQTVSVTLDTAAKGAFTGASVSASGFTSAGGGSYTFSGTAAAATTAVRLLVFAPTANRVAVGSTETTTFTLSINDGVAAAVTNSTTTAISTAINDVPTLTVISNPVAILEDAAQQTINLAGITAGGGETQTLVVTATSGNTALIPNPTVTYTSPNATGSLAYTPVANANGTALITVTVNDGQASNNTVTQTFTVTVNAVNDVPSFTKGGDQTVSVNSGGQTVAAWATNISAGPANESSQTVSFTITGNTDPSIFLTAPAVASNGTLTFTPSASTIGSATISIRADDNGSPTASSNVQSFVINVVAALPPDYTITNSGGVLTLTDDAGNGDTLYLYEPVIGSIAFDAAGRTFSINGGVQTTGSSGNISLSGITSIVVNAGGGSNLIGVGGFSGSSFPSLTVNGSTSADGIYLYGDISFASGANLNVDLQDDAATVGTDSVTVYNDADLIATGNGTITVRASGPISITGGGSLETQHGALTVEANQQAVSTSGNFNGITVDGAGSMIRATGVAVVTVKGKGGDDSGGAQLGINVNGGAKIIGGSSGTLDVAGTGGDSLNFLNRGITVYGTGSQITSGGASVSVIGRAGANGSYFGIGIAVLFGGEIRSLGQPLQIQGYGAGAEGSGYNMGIEVGEGTIATSGVGSSLGISASAGPGDPVGGGGSWALFLGASASVSVTSGGTITLILPSVSIDPSASITTSSSVIFSNAGRNLDLGGADTATALGLTDAELDRISTPLIRFTSNQATISAPITRSSATNITLGTNSLTAAVSGTDIDLAGGTFRPQAGLSMPITGQLPDTGFPQLKVNGLIDLTNVILGLNGTTNPNGNFFDSYVIVDNDGTDAITGTFNGLPEGELIPWPANPLLAAQITYVGGTGNDVMLTLVNPFEVTNTSDSGTGSLRQALASAAAAPGENTITFHSSLAGLPIPLSSQLEVNDQSGVIIDATSLSSSPIITDSGAANYRLLHVTSGSSLTVHGITFADGGSASFLGDGGAILNDGILTLDRCAINGCMANNGGAIMNGGLATGTVDLTLEQCVISGNSATNGGGGYGGAIHSVADGSATTNLQLIRCTLYGNSSSGSGGAIANSALNAATSNATLSMENCTVTANTSPQGGAIFATGSLSHAQSYLTHCTITGNTSNFTGGIHNSGLLTLANSIVSGNISTGRPNIGTTQPVILIGATIVSSLDSTDIANGPLPLAVDPHLAPLGNYGGPTPTMPPLLGSPAIDQAGVITSPPLIDQRGSARPKGIRPDIGAVEGSVLIVTTPVDELAEPGNGYSLREAVRDAANKDTILFDRAVFTGSNTLTLLYGPLNPQHDCTLDASDIPGGIKIVHALQFYQQPQSLSLVSGNDASFQVGTENFSGGIAYAWRKNGIDLPGQPTATLGIIGVGEGDEGLYDVAITEAPSPGSFTNTNVTLTPLSVLSAPASLIVDGSTVTIQRISIQAQAPVGTHHTLEVVAVGPVSPPLAYQWTFKGKNIRGATKRTFDIAKVALSHAGSYSCIVKSGLDQASATTELAVVDTKAKVVNLKAGLPFTPSVIAAGNGLQFAWKQDATPLMETNKSFLIPSVAGANSGLYTCTVSFQSGGGNSITTGCNTQLNVTEAIPQLGTFAPPAATIGQTYFYQVPVTVVSGAPATSFSLTGALPKGIVFNKTTGILSGRPLVSKLTGYPLTVKAINSKGPSLPATATLTVNVVPNTAAGTFAGPIERSSVINNNLGGRFDLTTTSAGTFTGSITLGAVKRSFKSQLLLSSGEGDVILRGNIPGIKDPANRPITAYIEVFAPEQLTRLTLLDFIGSPYFIQAWRKVPSATAANYTLRLDPGTVTDAPHGYGYSTLKATAKNSVTISGKLPDGTPLTGSSFIGANGQILIYHLLYKGKGTLVGQHQLTGTDVTGTQTWNRPTATTGTIYKDGFAPLTVTAAGSQYTPPTAGQLALPASSTLHFTDGGLAPDFDQPVTIANPKLTGLTNTAKPNLPLVNTTKIALFDVKTGALTGSFLIDTRPAPFTGQLVKIGATTEAYGFFLLPTATAKISTAPKLSGRVVLGP